MSYKSFQQCLLMTFSVALGTFSFAYNSYILNGPLDYIRIWLNINTSFKEGILMTSFNFGGLIGCIIGIVIIKQTSRRLMLYLIDILLIIGTIGLNIQNYYTFILFRIIAGLGSGLTTLVTPMFLKEIIPTQIYGVLGGQNLVLLSLGTIIQSICALGFTDVKGQSQVDMTFWRFYLLPPIIICIVRSSLLLFYFKYESPLYSIQQGHIQTAEEYIQYIYQEEDVDKIIEDIQIIVNKRNVEKQLPFPRIILGILTNIFYSNSGITPIISYSTKIFQQVATVTIAQILTIGMSVIKFIFYSTGAQLTQKYGRRNPLIIGTAILCIVLLSSGWSSSINDNKEYNETFLKSFVVVYIVIAIYLYFGVFFNTFGAIIPIYTPEILSGIYLTIALIFQWSFNIGVTLLFPIIRDNYGICYTFYYFGIMMGIATIYFLTFIKETKNLNDKQIDELWSQSYSEKECTFNRNISNWNELQQHLQYSHQIYSQDKFIIKVKELYTQQIDQQIQQSIKLIQEIISEQQELIIKDIQSIFNAIKIKQIELFKQNLNLPPFSNFTFEQHLQIYNQQFKYFEDNKNINELAISLQNIIQDVRNNFKLLLENKLCEKSKETPTIISNNINDDQLLEKKELVLQEQQQQLNPQIENPILQQIQLTNQTFQNQIQSDPKRNYFESQNNFFDSQNKQNQNFYQQQDLDNFQQDQYYQINDLRNQQSFYQQNYSQQFQEELPLKGYRYQNNNNNNNNDQRKNDRIQFQMPSETQFYQQQKKYTTQKDDWQVKNNNDEKQFYNSNFYNITKYNEQSTQIVTQNNTLQKDQYTDEQSSNQLSVQNQSFDETQPVDDNQVQQLLSQQENSKVENQTKDIYVEKQEQQTDIQRKNIKGKKFDIESSDKHMKYEKSFSMFSCNQWAVGLVQGMFSLEDTAKVRFRFTNNIDKTLTIQFGMMNVDKQGKKIGTIKFYMDQSGAIYKNENQRAGSLKLIVGDDVQLGYRGEKRLLMFRKGDLAEYVHIDRNYSGNYKFYVRLFGLSVQIL